MHTFNRTFQPNPSWRDLAIEFAATFIAFAIIEFAAMLFYWCFFIPFHWRYSLGAILAAVMLKWFVPNLQSRK